MLSVTRDFSVPSPGLEEAMGLGRIPTRFLPGGTHSPVGQAGLDLVCRLVL